MKITFRRNGRQGCKHQVRVFADGEIIPIHIFRKWDGDKWADRWVVTDNVMRCETHTLDEAKATAVARLEHENASWRDVVLTA